MARPRVSTLLERLPDVPVRLVERARHGSTEVYGHTDGESATISIRKARGWAKADTLASILIHELIHIVYPDLSEKQVVRWESHLFKSRALREAALTKLLNAALFGDE